MRAFRLIPLAAVVAVPLWLTGCATETSQALNATQTQSASRSYHGPRSPIRVKGV